MTGGEKFVTTCVNHRVLAATLMVQGMRRAVNKTVQSARDWCSSPLKRRTCKGLNDAIRCNDAHGRGQDSNNQRAVRN